MSNYQGPIFMQGDAVYYNGDKFKQALTNKEGKPFRGWIHASVQNEPGAFVVWFPDTKESDSYIMSADNLTKVRPAKSERHVGPEIQHMPSRRKASED